MIHRSTNNAVEAQNRVFKAKDLKGFMFNRVAAVFKIIVEQVIPRQLDMLVSNLSYLYDALGAM